mgnify:FL=1
MVSRSMTPTELDNLHKDLAILAKQQLELDQRLQEVERMKGNTGMTKSQAESIFKVIKQVLDKRDERLAASHDSVHKAAIRDVRESRMLTNDLAKSTFNEACDTLKGAVEMLFAGAKS